MTDVSKFRIRCSAISKIMAKPTGKRLVSAGAETFLKQWYIEKVYKRKPDIYSKYMDKGVTMEDNSIDFISDYLNYDGLMKNDEWLENDFMHGTPDVITDDCIIEVKNSWDCFTFPLLETECPKKDYFYQCQGYMHLTGHKKTKLIYVLMDTPEHLIQKEYRYKGDNNPFEYEDFRKKYLFSDVKEEYRIKVFDIDYDQEVINTIEDRVKLCREYLKNIKT